MSQGAPRLGYAAVVIGLAAFLFAVGLAGFAFEPLRPRVAPAAPWLLLAFGILVLLPALGVDTSGGRAKPAAGAGASSTEAPRMIVLGEGGAPAMLAWVLVSAALTFAVEAVGVATGQVFGPYSYGEGLGVNILDVPPLIGFNWVLVVAGCLGAARLIGLRGAGAVLAAALIATVFDWVMEPAAVALGYWRWQVNPIPLRNYLAWFVLALPIAAGRLAVEKLIRRRESETEPGRATRGPRSGGAGGAKPESEATYRTTAAPDRLAAAWLLLQVLFFAGIRALVALGLLPALPPGA